MSRILNVGQVLTVNAQLYPDRLAVKDSRRALSYAAYEERANRLANAMALLGLRQGDRVAVCAYNCLEWMELYAACAKSGTVAVPVNFRLTTPEVRYILEDAEVAAVFVGHELLDVVAPLRESLPIDREAWVQIGGTAPAPGFRSYEALLGQGAPRPPAVEVWPDDTWTIIYTSGTTGRPKGAVRSHRSYALFYLLNAVEFGFDRNDVGLTVMPLSHVNSVFYSFVFTYIGASAVIYDRRNFDPEHLLGVLADEGITYTSLVPTHYVMMLSLPAATRARHDLSRVRRLLISSAPARRDTKLAIMACFPNSQLFEAYGSTEAGLVTLLRPEQQFDKIGSIGREIVGTGRIRLLDATGREVPDGQVGELFASTPTAFDGYWRLPEASASAFREGYCTAGDMARRDAEGFYTLVDRKSNVIITGGEKVYPSEVEQVLVLHPDVREVAVIATPDAKWGEAVTAVVVPEPGRQPTADALLEFAGQRLANYKRPRAVWVIREEDMPRTATGKVLHRVLRDRYADAQRDGPAIPAAASAGQDAGGTRR